MTHWVLGEFADPDALLNAVKALRGEHVRELDTHTPYLVPGLEQAIGVQPATLGPAAFIGGLAGAALASGLVVWSRAGAAWRPAVLLGALLFAALAVTGAFVARFAAPRHPAFRHEPFVKTACTTGFWLSVNTRVPEDAEKARGRLEALGAKNVALIVEGEKK